jgi:hypothetical protein
MQKVKTTANFSWNGNSGTDTSLIHLCYNKFIKVFSNSSFVVDGFWGPRVRISLWV